jgi:hypothetical protein
MGTAKRKAAAVRVATAKAKPKVAARRGDPHKRSGGSEMVVTLAEFSESDEPLRLSRDQAKRVAEIQKTSDRDSIAYVKASQLDLR